MANIMSRALVVADHRDAASRERERIGVDRHLREWRHARSSTARRRRALATLQKRRALQSRLVQFDVVPDTAGAEVLALRGELLVRQQDLGSAVVRLLTRRWGLRSRPVEDLDGRVVRLVSGDMDGQLPRVLASIRALGAPIAAHHVTAMSAVYKGLAGPVPSAGGRVFPDAPINARDVAIAVLDTGIDARPRNDGWLDGWAAGSDIDPLDAIPAQDGWLDLGAGHGTFTSGVLQQVAPSARVKNSRVLDSDGIGSDVGIACAMLRAADDGAQIINLSLGTTTVDDEPPMAMQIAVDLLAERHPDVLVVAAAGNDGGVRPCWPAAFPDVVSVGGLTPGLQPAGWSNRGDWVTCSAIAEGVVSTYVQGRSAGIGDEPPVTFGPDAWACWTGTSFAAPQVAAAVAQRCSETGASPRRAFADLISGGPSLPGYGAVLDLLPGT